MAVGEGKYRTDLASDNRSMSARVTACIRQGISGSEIKLDGEELR